MQVSEHKPYNFEDSNQRIEGYLSHPVDAETVDKVPIEDRFDYNTGYYVNCCAIFVDIRDSSSLTDEDTKKNISKIYRSFVSEITALMQSYKQCKHVNIVGDCVSGIFDTSNGKKDIYSAFSVAGSIITIINSLNTKLKNHDLPQIKVGIGIDYGKTLVVKAGYKGSGLDELVWMGDVVNNAAHLCDKASKDGNPSILCSKDFYDGLGDYPCVHDSPRRQVKCTSFFEQYTDYYGGDFYKIQPGPDTES